MTFAQIQGNDDVKQALTGMVDEGRIPHAILFHEDDGGGAFPIALAFLQYLFCRERSGGDSCGRCPSCGKIGRLIHPDVHFVFPTAAGALSEQFLEPLRRLVAERPAFREAELTDALGLAGKVPMIAVAESRRLLEKLSLSALEGGWRAVVIYLPERMNAEAANRLLKIIEEPPAQTQFLLIAHQMERVLPTIASRCQRIRVRAAGAVIRRILVAYPSVRLAVANRGIHLGRPRNGSERISHFPCPHCHRTQQQQHSYYKSFPFHNYQLSTFDF